MEHETEPAEAEEAETVLAETVQRAGGFPATGEPRVDAALKLLDRLPGLPVADHPELFEQVHAELTDVLGELDSGAGGAVGPHAS